MKVTIYDVAERAGVSIATVSKVINNTGNMREETRKRILKIIEEMNYHPSIMATALTGKSTQTLGLLVPDISNPFFSAMARSIEDYAHEQGFNVIMCSIDGDADKERHYIQLLLRKQIDGIIVTSTLHNKDMLDDLNKSRIPIVMLAYDDTTLDSSIVSVDDFKGGYEAASHLFAKGHRNIAIIAEHTHSSDLRIYGFKVALEGRGITLNEDNIIRVHASISNGKQSFEKIYKKENRPTAIFACNDLLAIGVIQGATGYRYRIPEDLAIIGFDNTILATTTVPGLTTIAQPVTKMAKKTVELMVEQIKENKRITSRVLFEPELIIRGTS